MEGKGNSESWLCKDAEPIPIYQDWSRHEMSQMYNNNLYMGNADGASEFVINLSDSLRTQLAYQSCQKAMDVETYRTKREIDFAYDERKHSQKIDRILAKEIVSYEVYKGACGELFYAQIGADDRRIHTKKLCSAIDIVSKIMRSRGKKVREILHLAWYGNLEGVSFRLGNGRTEISSKKFGRMLKARGVFFPISRRCEAEVIDALLAYVLNSAEVIEIPDRAGWNRMLDGRLHFAKKDEITMSEVLKNAI